jgi:hypothetical protein
MWLLALFVLFETASCRCAVNEHRGKNGPRPLLDRVLSETTKSSHVSHLEQVVLVFKKRKAYECGWLAETHVSVQNSKLLLSGE